MIDPDAEYNRPHWTAYGTFFAALVGAFAVIGAAVSVWVMPSMFGQLLEAGSRPLHQAVCMEYSDFVLTQAHNGYTPEEIQHVLDFAGNHATAKEEPPVVPSPEPASSAPIAPTSGGPLPSAPPPPPLRSSHREYGPSLTDERMCGTPAQVLEAAGVTQPPK
ncbi:hypothetical protein [Mycobacteroides abscessus]|uniref:hypothetical protein n=1 Tax=Mycobacteroides abscessus TaxID=36809 RepID=UPI001042062E|nr:hypothetical protein [Mycobacteroides abscessus]